MVDDLFQGEVPGRLILGLISSSAMHGDVNKNPFIFKHFGCNYIGFYVNGQSMPNHPLQPNYDDDQFMEAFQTLNKEGKKRTIEITRKENKDGYCLYIIDPRGVYNKSRPLQRGHTRLELKFASALPKFPALAKIDQSRKVTLE
jgi:hypothetical protein